MKLKNDTMGSGLKRTVVFVLLALLAAGTPAGGANRHDPDPPYGKEAVKELKRSIKHIVSGKKATVGVAVATEGHEVLTLHPRGRFPLMSVFKFHIALAVLDKLDKNNVPLDSLLFIEKSKLLHDTYSPMIKDFPNQDLTISIGDLINYCVSQSDNNACDFLIEYAGGIQEVEDYVMKLGVTGLNLSVPERTMHDDITQQYTNWSTPGATTDLLRIFLTKPLFKEQYKDFLIQAMTNTSTGKNKLKCLLPPRTVVGHKTGSSNRTEKGIQIAENDIAFIYLPGGGRYYVSVLVKDSREDDETNVEIIARVSKVIYDFLCREDSFRNKPGM